jgi:hypothetical protein
MLCEIYCILRRVTIKEWPVHERIELPYLILRTGHHMYHSTGFDREEIIDLCIRVNSVERETGTPGWPPCLGPFQIGGSRTVLYAPQPHPGGNR